MSRWFRMYDEALDDPKVQRLSGDDFKSWVNLLCLASRNGGWLPPIEDISFALRLEPKKAAAMFGRLCAAGLIDEHEQRFKPHKWDDRQFKSDVSTDRVKRFRKRSKKQHETGNETAPDTETETDSSVDKSTAADAPLVDPLKVMFDTGIAYLATCGMSEPKSRSVLGKWNKDHGAGRVIEALGAAQRGGIIDPVPWIEARWKAANDPGGKRYAEAPC